MGKILNAHPLKEDQRLWAAQGNATSFNVRVFHAALLQRGDDLAGDTVVDIVAG